MRKNAALSRIVATGMIAAALSSCCLFGIARPSFALGEETDGASQEASQEQPEAGHPDGWETDDAGARYFWQQGSMVKGLVKIDGKLYLFDEDGKLVADAGWHEVDGTWYLVDDASAVATGWKKVNGAWYYFDEMGAMQTGWQKIGGSWYWLENSGAMATGWRNINGYWYYLKDSGAMATGWINLGGTWYWLEDSGAMVTGWAQIDGSWYWFDDSGAMATGWRYVNGYWYYLTGSGAMATGWIQTGGSWYWLEDSGAMVRGWKQIDGKWNAFDKVSGVWRTDNEMLVAGWYKAQAISSSTDWFILVDDMNTKTMIYYWNVDEWMPLYIFDCSTGAWTSRTVHGTFKVGLRGYSFGHGYTCYWWTQFYGDYLFHTIKYRQGTWIPLDPVLNDHRSEGCVRLSAENAKWIYDNIPYGTTVHVF